MKRLLALVFLMQTVLLAFAGQVDLPKAQAIAQHFMLQHRAHGRMMASQATDVRLAYQQMGSIRVSQPVYYVFNSERGFVIVAGDDRAQEILAYGSQPLDMNMIPENMKFWLGYYQKQMEVMIKDQEVKVDAYRAKFEVARIKLTRAVQERKMQERLKEKAFEQFMEEEKEAEAKARQERMRL